MNIPIELICKIISYIPKKKCYRCNKTLLPIDKLVLYDNYTFCSSFCIEYPHY